MSTYVNLICIPGNTSFLSENKMTKFFLFTMFTVCITGSLLAQVQQQGAALYHYVFPSFIEGTVKQKSGEVNKALLNYNSLTEEMIFEQSGRQMALDKTENIDTVYIENKKFIPVNNVFYEMVTNTPVALFIQHKSTVIPPGGNTGFGTSQTSAITSITDLKRAGTAYRLALPGDYKLTSKTVYWLKNNNNYITIKNAKDVQDLFPDRSGAIKDFVKANKINFKNSDDVIKLIMFCN